MKPMLLSAPASSAAAGLASTAMSQTMNNKLVTPAAAAGEANMISAAFPYRKQRRRVLGREMSHRAAARQSHLVVPLAQRVAAPAATRPLHRPRPDRHGRLRQAAQQWAKLVSLRRAPPLPRRPARGPGCARAGHLRHP